MELIQETCEFMVENIQWSPKICQHFGAKHFCCCCCCCFSVSKLWLGVILCDPMNCSIPGFPVLHCLLEFAWTPIHWVGDAIQPSHPLSSPCPPTVNHSASGSFHMSQFFASGGQSIGVSASASVLPINIQDRFSLGWTGWISLLCKGLSRVFSNIPVQKHQFFCTQLSL